MNARISTLSVIILLPGCSLFSKSTTENKPPATFMGLPLLVVEEFDQPSPRWDLNDPKAWEYTRDGDRTVLALARNSTYKPPFRSPPGVAILKDVTVSDLVLDAWLRSTHFNYPHRDMCVFFGYQDPARFYYAHLGLKSDSVSNTIHIVDNADRRPIIKTRTDGTPWTEGYHHVRVVRKVDTGSVEVFFDDMTTPSMTAETKTFQWGRIGLASFDETGNFDRVVLWGHKANSPEAPPPPP